MELNLFQIFFTFILLGFSRLLFRLYYLLIWKPRSLRSKLVKQGIKGPPPSFLYGNIPDVKKIQSTLAATAASDVDKQVQQHDYFDKVFPYFHQWANKYGPMFTYSTGNVQLLYVDPSLVKDISLCTSLDLGKPTHLIKERGPLLGRGILKSSGSLWAHQRKIIAPEFYMDKVKVMLSIVTTSTSALIKSWEDRIELEGGVAPIKIDEDLRSISADIISKVCFGHNYYRGKEICLKLKELHKVMSKKGILIGVPGSSYIPTGNNKAMWKLEQEVDKLILEVVNERRKAKRKPDLLQSIIDGAENGNLGTYQVNNFIVDSCKNICFAGYETVASSASWILMLLATNQKWQARVRDEVMHACGNCHPTVDMIRSMKTLTMVIQEGLRLYPPAPFVTREAFTDMKFGDIHIPKGVVLWIPLISMHKDHKIWGADVHEFNPNRFAQGIRNACNLSAAYIPFGIGPRVCAGQNLAMFELKVTLAHIVSKFSFKLSPQYCHSPTFKMGLAPENGIELLIKKVELEQY